MDVAGTYDTVAERYAEAYGAELEHKPYDRALLDAVAVAAADGPLLDLGCGPGHISSYLRSRGREVLGVDLSPRMVEIASARYPDVEFRVGDMRALDLPDGGYGGVVAPYSLIHLTPAERPAACAEIARVLSPGGLAMISFHLPAHPGAAPIHLDEWFDQPVSLDGYWMRREDLLPPLAAAGLHEEAYLERQPSPGVEYPSTRGYLLLRKPATP
ncbi:MAG: class I SAM-dependent methyltransferase [Mycobacteriales bacterium]